jgi:hypothetical protein
MKKLALSAAILTLTACSAADIQHTLDRDLHAFDLNKLTRNPSADAFADIARKKAEAERIAAEKQLEYDRAAPERAAAEKQREYEASPQYRIDKLKYWHSPAGAAEYKARLRVEVGSLAMYDDYCEAGDANACRMIPGQLENACFIDHKPACQRIEQLKKAPLATRRYLCSQGMDSLCLGANKDYYELTKRRY